MIGDLNICTLKRSAYSAEYTNLLSTQGLLPVIKTATGEEMLSGKPNMSRIDVRVSSKYEMASVVVREKIADHYFVGLQIYKTTVSQEERRELNQVKYVQIRNEQKIQKKIVEYDW